MNKEEILEVVNNSLLPKLREGIELSKPYFIDLFDRYITYYIINQLLLIWLFLGIIIWLLYYYKKIDLDDIVIEYFIKSMCIVLIIVFIGIMIHPINNIIKISIIPEYVIYNIIK